MRETNAAGSFSKMGIMSGPLGRPARATLGSIACAEMTGFEAADFFDFFWGGLGVITPLFPSGPTADSTS